MSELIPSYSLTDFRRIVRYPDKLKILKSCEVTFNGDYLFTFVNPQTDYIKLSIENLSQLSNSLSGVTMEELLETLGSNV